MGSRKPYKVCFIDSTMITVTSRSVSSTDQIRQYWICYCDLSQTCPTFRLELTTCNLTVCGRLGCIDAGSVIILHCVTFLRCSWHFWSKIFAHLSTRAFLKLFLWTKLVVLWTHTLLQLTVCHKATPVSTSIAVHIQNIKSASQQLKSSSPSPSRQKCGMFDLDHSKWLAIAPGILQ